MKNKFLSIAILFAIAVTASWNYNKSENKANLSDLALENVEAIAAGEGEDGKLYPGYEIVRHSNEDGNLVTVCTGDGYLYCV